MNGVIRITDPAKLGAALAQIRNLLGLSRSDLGRLIETDTGRDMRGVIKQIQQWDNGRHSPNAASLGPVLDALGYDLALVPQEDGPATVHTTQAKFITELFWAQHIDPVAQAEGLKRPTQIDRDPGDVHQHLFKHPDGRVLLIIRTDREEA